MDPSSVVIIDDDDDEDDLPIIQCLTPSKRVQTKINFDKPITPFLIKPIDVKKEEGPKAKLSMTSLLKNQMKEQEIEKKVEDIVELEDEFNRGEFKSGKILPKYRNKMLRNVVIFFSDFRYEQFCTTFNSLKPQPHKMVKHVKELF